VNIFIPNTSTYYDVWSVNVPKDTILPVGYVHLESSITQSNAEDLKSGIAFGFTFAIVIAVVFILIGIILLFVGVGICVYDTRQELKKGKDIGHMQ
jgi:hypothetical protein